MMDSLFQMLWLQQFCFLGGGKFRWVTDLMVEADNHKPVAYIVAFICLCVVIAGLVAFVIEWYRLRNANANWRKHAELIVGTLGALGLPGFLLYCLASRLFA